MLWQRRSILGCSNKQKWNPPQHWAETEYEILRTLIEKDLIPDDVTIQVLVQSREHLIRKTFEAIDGAKNVIIHFYNSTSTLQRKVVFKIKGWFLQIKYR